MTDDDKVVPFAGRDRRPKPAPISPLEMEKLLAALGPLSPVEYGLQRFDLAEKLGVPRHILDREYLERHQRAKEDGSEADFIKDCEPWPTQVAGADLLTEIATAAAKHIAMPKGGAEVLALWTVFTHCHESFDIAPLLALTSPTAECGKTTALTFLSGTTSRALNVSNVTPSALFRTIHSWSPTLLVDEADTFLRDSDELRGIFNSGHQRTNAFILRTVGGNKEPKRFRTWGPKAVALIGKLPPTLASRSIEIRLKRSRQGDDQLEPLRAGHTSHLEPLARKAARWNLDNLDRLSNTAPAMPTALYARALDNWRPLFAIASLAGGDWLERLTEISERLAARQEDYSVVLLHDVAAVFAAAGADKLSSADIVAELAKMEGRPWPEWKSGKPLSQNQLADVLGRFDVVPGTVRLASGKTPKGYHLRSLSDALSHYPPFEPPHRHKP
ncbi:MAG: DUF3631 domain-containing protein [Methyloceanibacter sp.]|jgi:hypothetical protein